MPKRAYTIFDSTREFEDRLAAHISVLIERKLHSSGRREAVWKQGSPFRGLNAFDLEHAPVFWSRSRYPPNSWVPFETMSLFCEAIAGQKKEFEKAEKHLLDAYIGQKNTSDQYQQI